MKIMFEYYNRGSNKGVGHLRAIITLMIFFLLFVFSFMKVIDFDFNEIDPVVRDKGPLIEYLGGFIIGIPLLLLLIFLLPKKQVLKIRLTDWQRKYGMKLIFLSLILSFGLFVLILKSF